MSTPTTETATSSTMSEIRYNPLSLPRFSGTTPTPKSEASYKVWKYQLEAIKDEESLTENQSKQIIRRSLCGEAAEVIVGLPVTATTSEIISTLEDNYGCDREKVDGWSRFHAATQKPDETVTTWQMRLIGLISDADPGNTFKEHRDKLLITTFWSNLYNKDLKIATAYMRKSATTFAEFFRAVKSEEPLYGKRHDAMPFKSTVCSTDMAELRDELEKMRVENDKLKKQLWESSTRDNRQSQRRQQIVCYHCGETGHIKPKCSKFLNSIRQGTMGFPLTRKQ